LEPLPYPGSDRLVTIYEGNPAKNQNTSLGRAWAASHGPG
jgi:hypothetical protein